MSRHDVMPSPEERRPREVNTSRLEVGTVVSQQPGTNRIDVRLRGSHHRVVRNVLVPYGAAFQTDDTVLVCRVQTEAAWLAIVKVEATDEFGLSLSQVVSETDLHPPSNFTVVGLPGFVLGTWSAWPGRATCFEVQYNTTQLDAGGSHYTYGGQFIWDCEPPGKRYVRVRSLRYDVGTYDVFVSAWTAWAYATPQFSSDQILALLGDLQVAYERLWVMAVEGAISCP